MSNNMILLPALAQVLLTMVLYGALAVAKAKATKSGLVDADRRALHDDAWPVSVTKINNNIRNQFELPVLFYVLTIVLWQLKETGMFAQSLAWLFVASRCVHASIHTGSNYVPARRKVFMFGCAVVLVMAGVAAWAVLAS
ncbi:MAG: MAPEG family protein [Proteobacteria bacterium]|nr:MAPEG family protein [Pseudomonadota bacterium]